MNLNIIIDSYLTRLDKKAIQLDISKYPRDFNVIDLRRFIWLKEFNCELNPSYKSNNSFIPKKILSIQPIAKILNPPITLEKLICSGNNITNLDYFKSCYNLKYIDCSFNLIEKINYIPCFLIELDISSNKIINLDNLPNNLKKLNCSENKISNLDNLPEHLDSLVCSSNKIINLNNLPCLLVSLDCSSNKITNLDNLSSSIKYLCCSNNPLINLDWLPSSIEVLVCYNNYIKNFDNLPSSIKNIRH
jgi:hypothetical protein